MLQLIAKNWFLAAIAMCFFAGWNASNFAGTVSRVPLLREAIVFSVMWATGITLRADSVARSWANPSAAFIAITANILLVPLLVLPTRFFLPAPIYGGLLVAALVPCTLASAAVWTRKAGGDDSIAIMTTVATNLACVFVIPTGLMLLPDLAFNEPSTETIPQSITGLGQFQKLACIVIAPLVLAQAMRRVGWSDWADQNKSRLSMLAQLGILVMVCFGSAAGAKAFQITPTGGSDSLDPGTSSFSDWSFPLILQLVAACVSVHTIALTLATLAGKFSRLDPPQQIACGISGSQKTLMVGLQISIDCGVSVVPMLIFHACQLFIDTLVADGWRNRHGESNPADTADEQE